MVTPGRKPNGPPVFVSRSRPAIDSAGASASAAIALQLQQSRRPRQPPDGRRCRKEPKRASTGSVRARPDRPAARLGESRCGLRGPRDRAQKRDRQRRASTSRSSEYASVNSTAPFISITAQPPSRCRHQVDHRRGPPSAAAAAPSASSRAACGGSRRHRASAPRRHVRPPDSPAGERRGGSAPTTCPAATTMPAGRGRAEE